MPGRVLVAGPPQVLEAVRRALPDMEVALAPSPIDEEFLFDSDCVVVGAESARFGETWQIFAQNIPVVRLVQGELQGEAGSAPTLPTGDAPCAHVESQMELRLAIRTAVLEHRLGRLLAELTGPWAHDARGALGVSRLALELVKASGGPPTSSQKMENGLVRLGFLLERLPCQLALALDLPLPLRSSPSLFPNLDSYVAHLRLVHSHREIELLGGEWTASEGSRTLVPFAAGFVELALALSTAKAKVRFSADREHGLELECECPGRPAPWNAPLSLAARELCRDRDAPLPYRLVEAARLSLRSGMQLTVELSARTLIAKVRPSDGAAAV